MWACLWAAVALLSQGGLGISAEDYLHHYASGDGDESKPPPQPFGGATRPSQLANLHPEHPLYIDEDLEFAASEPIKTFWPTKVNFQGHHHVRAMKKAQKVRPPHLPPIPPFISDEMTQAIFLDNPQFAASSLDTRRPLNFFPGGRGRGKKERPAPPTDATPASSSTSTLQPPDTTTYFINSSLVDLTGDSLNTVPTPVFSDAASTPSDEGLKDYLVPPLENAFSEYANYNNAGNSGSSGPRGRPPFKVLRVNGKPKKGGKARFRNGPPSPNLLFGESQKAPVYKIPPQIPPLGGPLPPRFGPYRPIPPNQGGFMKYLFTPDVAPSTTPYPAFFPNFLFGGGENEIPRGQLPLKVNKKKQLPQPYAPHFTNPNFFNYNSFRPSTSTVIVPDKTNGWVPIDNPYPGMPLRSTPIPQFLQPQPHFAFGSTLPPPFHSSPRPHPRPVYLTPQPSRSTTVPVITTTTPSTQQTTYAISEKSTPVTTPTPQKTRNNIEILPSIETPPLHTQSNNPISQFNAEYFLQQALTQVRHQIENEQKESRNHPVAPQHPTSPQQPTRRSFVSELPNSDEEEVIYQNPVFGEYRDPYVTIHYPMETRFRFRQRLNQHRARGLLDVSADANQLFAGTTGHNTNPPSYYDFHLNNIPTTLPPQPTEASEFHYLMSAVKPKVVHEKDRTSGKKNNFKEPKPEQARRPTGEPFLVYPEPTTPSPDQLFSMSHVTPKTLRGLRLGGTTERSHVESKREIKPSDESDLEVLPAEGGLYQHEITHYHAPVRADAQFI